MRSRISNFRSIGLHGERLKARSSRTRQCHNFYEWEEGEEGDNLTVCYTYSEATY